jgi:hypothetical protein
MKIGDPIMRMF